MSDITILLALHSDFCQEGMKATLSQGSGYCILEFAYTTAELLYKAPQHQPDLIVIDTDLPGMDTVEVCLRLQQLCPLSGIIGRSKDDVIYDARRLMKVGVRGMLEKDASKSEIKECLKKVHEGNIYYCLACCHLAKSKIANEEELTETQDKVFGKMREGKKTGQIADELCIGQDTARRIRGVINDKAESNNLFLIYDWGIYKGHFSRKLSLLKNRGR